MLFISAMATTVAYMFTFRKLTRRAILVFPIFGPRSAESSANERANTKRSATHAASQALTFCLLHMPFAAYLVWISTANFDRLQEVRPLFSL